MSVITPKELYAWCKVPYQELENHPQRKVPFRLRKDSDDMGQIMARELVDEIKAHNDRGEATRAITPCGPSCWYEPFMDLVNQEKVNLTNLVVFHMDECLDSVQFSLFGLSVGQMASRIRRMTMLSRLWGQ
jgi:glucosamine-6-phosphate deaminase